MNSKKTVAIHQPQYLPWIPYFDKILQSDQFVLLDNVQFQKNGLQNRNEIKTSQGKTWLTVPIKHSFGQAINETEIASQKGVSKHLKTLEQNYRKSPYFDAIFPLVESTILKEHKLLSDLNCKLLIQFLKYIGFEGKLVLASEMNCQGQGSDLILNICKKLGATRYLSGPGGKNYMNLNDFKKNNIEVIFQKYHNIPYPQIYEKQGFVKDLSAIDLFFNAGPKSSAFIAQGRFH